MCMMLPACRVLVASCSMHVHHATGQVLKRLVCRQEKDKQQASAAILTQELLWLEGAFDSNGPFFAGEVFRYTSWHVSAAMLQFCSMEP